MAALSWNPALYLANAAPRLRPAMDLLFRARGCADDCIVKRVLDLGCGPGNITGHLAKAFADAEIHGVDSSPEMIDVATKRLAADESLGKRNIVFSCSTIENMIKSESGKRYDVIYSNAALHWVKDHRQIFPAMVTHLLSNSGVLAVQMPDTWSQPSHTLMKTAAERCGYSELIKSVRIPRAELNDTEYYDILKLHCESVDIWTTKYVQVLRVADAQHPVFTYTSATGLQPILEALRSHSKKHEMRFVEEYQGLLGSAYPETNDASGDKIVLFPFQRMFIVAKKKATKRCVENIL